MRSWSAGLRLRTSGSRPSSAVTHAADVPKSLAKDSPLVVILRPPVLDAAAVDAALGDLGTAGSLSDDDGTGLAFKKNLSRVFD